MRFPCARSQCRCKMTHHGENSTQCCGSFAPAVYPPRVSYRGFIRSLPLVAAILFVLAVYAFFAGDGKFDFRRLGTWQETNYASLAEGFYRGHLYLWVTPDPRLTALPYPYDFKPRYGIDYRWDT